MADSTSLAEGGGGGLQNNNSMDEELRKEIVGPRGIPSPRGGKWNERGHPLIKNRESDSTLFLAVPQSISPHVLEGKLVEV